MVGFFVKAFHGGFVVDEGDDDVAVAADGGLPHHYDVTVVDAGIFHALAPDMESDHLSLYEEDFEGWRKL